MVFSLIRIWDEEQVFVPRKLVLCIAGTHLQRKILLHFDRVS